MIWLLIKLTSNFGNEYRIYFPDYDTNDSSLVNKIIRSFDLDNLKSRLTIHKISSVSPIEIASLPIVSTSKSLTKRSLQNNSPLELSNELFSDYLPYGDLIKPFLKTSRINAKEIKYLLGKRGVFFKHADKDRMIVFTTSLLFGPTELNLFQEMIDVEEKIGKSNEYYMNLLPNISIQDVFEALPRVSQETVVSGLSTTIARLNRYKISPSKDSISLEIITETNNPTNHISLSKSIGRIRMEIKISDNKLLISNINTVSKEDRIIARRIVKANESSLLTKKIILKGVKQIRFSDFEDNLQRMNFMLSFSNLGALLYAFKGTVTSMKFQYDDRLEIPSDLKDKSQKELTIDFKGKNLEGLKEIEKSEIKEIMMIEQISVTYEFKWKNISSLYFVNYKFPGVLKSKEKDAVFETEINIFKNSQIKKMVGFKNLESDIINSIDKFKNSKFKQFGLI